VSGPTQKGEAAIIKLRISHSFVLLVNLKFIEAVAIKINLYGQGDVVIVSAYKSPVLPLLPKELDIFLNHREAVILCGDLNCTTTLNIEVSLYSAL
jgi:hypothetical protein